MALRLVPLAELPAPIAVAGPGPAGELYLADQTGLILTYRLGVTSIFLDLRPQTPPLNPSYDERGLLDIVMSPQQDRLFAFYTSLSGRNRLVEIDLQTKMTTPLLNVLDRSDIHNGGRMAFGPDGYLYLGLGDGGQQDNAQNLSSLLGKMLRLNVVGPGGYQIPYDNPFLHYPGLRPEIYAYGFRNPSGIAFSSRAVGYVTDAGLNTWEEIDLLQKGGNYGWNIKEGTDWTNLAQGTTGGTRLPATPPDLNQPFVDPIYEYRTKQPGGIAVQSSAIIGGAFFPDGTFVFADYGGVLMTLSPNYQLASVQRVAGYIRAISQDEAGQIYVMTSDRPGPVGRGQINRLERN